MSIHDPPRLCFEPPKLLNFDLYVDQDPAFHSNADFDPASKNDADPCGYGSTTLEVGIGISEYRYAFQWSCVQTVPVVSHIRPVTT